MKILSILLAITFILAASSCSADVHEGFAIYLLAEGISPQQLPVLSHLALAEKPLLTVEDIAWYQSDSHEMRLTEKGVDSVLQLNVPVHGLAFAVCIDQTPVYAGAFWGDFSSVSYDGVVIVTTRTTRENPILQLQLGYPGASFFHGQDPRADAKIFSVLQEAGKLKSNR
jgi:hypothetical protein